jgi:hypothetical protein
MDLRKASLRENVAWAMALAGSGEETEVFLSKVEQGFTVPEIQELRQRARTELNRATRRTLNDFIAGRDWDTMAGAVVDITVQEMTPFYNVASKVGLNRQLMDAMGMPDSDKGWFLLGSQRQRMREFLVNLSDAEREDAITGMIHEVNRLEQDTSWGPFIRKFNVLEQFEAVLTLFTGIVAKRFGKTFRRVFGAHEETFTINRVMREARQREAQARLNNAVRGKVAEDQGAGALDVDTALDMPRPKEFVDERVVLLPGVRETIERTERIAGKLHEKTAGRLFRVLGEEGRANTADKLLDSMQLGNRAEVVPAMSVIEETADGVRARVILSKNGKETWNSLDELVPDLAQLDPTLEVFRIMRRGDDGLLHHVDMDATEFARRATEPGIMSSMSSERITQQIR